MSSAKDGNLFDFTPLTDTTEETDSPEVTYRNTGGDAASQTSVTIVHQEDEEHRTSIEDELKSRRCRKILLAACVALTFVVIIAVAVTLGLRLKTQEAENDVHGAFSSFNTEFFNVTFTTEGATTKTAVFASTAAQGVLQFTTTEKSRTTTINPRVATLIQTGWYAIDYESKWYLYKITPRKSNYTIAKSKCSSMNATLGAEGLRIQDIRKRLNDIMVFPLNSRIYIGLDDLESHHTWKWADGVYSTHGNTDWARNEPSGAADRCAEIQRNRGLSVSDIACSTTLYSLCEFVQDH